MQHKVEIRENPGRRLFAVDHTGPHDRIAGTFAQLQSRLMEAELLPQMGDLVAVYREPSGTDAPVGDYSLAGMEATEEMSPPEGVRDHRLPPGPAAVLTHQGSYSRLGESYAHLFEAWLPEAGRTPSGPPFEVYLNTPEDTPSEALLTEIHVPLAAE